MGYYLKIFFFRIVDIVLSPLTLIAVLWLRFLRSSLHTKTVSPVAEKIYMSTGLFPVPDQYYQPLINPRKYLTKSLADPRALPAIDFNDDEQLTLLDQFRYTDELQSISRTKVSAKDYYYNNRSFEAGDSEYLYNFIRHFKPAKIVEIGCGFSTLMARKAIQANQREDADYCCTQICIEPFEMAWLEELNIQVVRKKVEDVEMEVFRSLGANDILFIDSSHIIRPQGDVLFEYLEILPALKSGVLIHVHDIFSPADYPESWVCDDHRLWNEQYLLEAFLSYNKEFRILGSVNYLFRNYPDKITSKCPVLKEQRDARNPASFWMIKS